MYRLIGLIAVIALVLAVPASAQQDTSMAGRQGEGLAAPEAPPADTGRMAGEEEMEMEGEMAEEGADMPTTGSALPLVAAAGVLLTAVGFGLRYFRGRS